VHRSSQSSNACGDGCRTKPTTRMPAAFADRIPFVESSIATVLLDILRWHIAKQLTTPEQKASAIEAERPPGPKRGDPCFPAYSL
jgi:hypothetical protein